VVTERTYQRVSAPSRAEIERAAVRIGTHLRATPLIESPQLEAFLKLETLQPTGSFKVRGAVAALSCLGPPRRVVAASAGNHGLGVAWASEILGIESTVVVPTTASPAKLEALERFPARLVRYGSSYDEAEARALELCAAGSRYVSPYNDREVIAGAGSVALELFAQAEGPLTIVCPVGGGGLCAGVSLAAAGRAGTRVIGVEAEASRAVSTALAAGSIRPIVVGTTLADGLAGNLEPDSVTVELIRAHTHSVISVSEGEISGAIRFLLTEHGVVAEGAGAAATAAVLAGRVAESATVVALVTGRNIDGRDLAAILSGS
jgi:threonine dehydratase